MHYPNRQKLLPIITSLACLLSFTQLNAMEKDEEIIKPLSSCKAVEEKEGLALNLSLIESLPNEIGMHIIQFLIPKNILGTDHPYSYLNLAHHINLKDILAIQQTSQRLNTLATAVLKNFVRKNVHPHEIMYAQLQAKNEDEVDWSKLAINHFLIKQGAFHLKSIYQDSKKRGFELLKKAAEQGSLQAYKKIISKALSSFSNAHKSIRDDAEKQALKVYSQLNIVLVSLPLEEDEKTYLNAKYANFLQRHSFLPANYEDFQKLNIFCSELYNVLLQLMRRNHPKAHYIIYKFWPYTFAEEDKLAVLKSSADAGYAPAQNLWGIELKAQGDRERSKYYLGLAAGQKNALACYNLKSILEEEGDITGSMYYNDLAVSLGAVSAFYDLGNYYYHIKKDTKRAEEYYWLAAVQGHPYAQERMGILCYHEGQLGPAQHFLLRAAAKNLPIATLQLAYLLLNTGDKESSADYFRQVNDNGERKIQYELGVIHWQEGRTGQAEYYFTLSAEQEFIPSVYGLGRIYYEKGETLLSKYYMKKAAAAKYAEAQVYLKDLERIMRQEISKKKEVKPVTTNFYKGKNKSFHIVLANSG